MTSPSATAFAQARMVIRAEIWAIYRQPWTRTLGLLFPYSAVIGALLVLTFSWSSWTIPILTVCGPAAIVLIIGIPAELIDTLRTPKRQRWYTRDDGVAACARVRRRRDGSWRVVSVAAWPPHLGGGGKVMDQVIAWADHHQRRLELTASTRAVAAWYHRRYNFGERGRRRLHRIPQPQARTSTIAGAASISGRDPRST